jgi:hypothetical protein
VPKAKNHVLSMSYHYLNPFGRAAIGLGRGRLFRAKLAVGSLEIKSYPWAGLEFKPRRLFGLWPSRVPLVFDFSTKKF